ncbi:imidazole glycerol phosphate synthase subunit HisF [Sphaerochaeta sp. PS]|uniref:imidazole glycerol phosphate synthase subunit HisF n=1 Tax=Sphaerochaeta sp. PS TaxID=3076336 RepID=UPI0028A53784|nr:imidazole glycerol phosphate synthase subunit HisF [Sphaerochaeta sp. PS]MDT4762528.1 imidazole glycerol phosphate synthase subunit HisF [Sphaerochaeta sp. PS]
MLAKRIIPCLDVRDGRTVKGVNFINLRDAGDAVELAQLYSASGADELTFLDITATVENRSTFSALVRRIADHIGIPFTVGGGIRTIGDVGVLLDSGADKISINSQAVADPSVIDTLALQYGSQCIVCAIDARRNPRFDSATEEGWEVYVHGGRKPTGLEVVAWAKEAYGRGCGEILLTSMENDGVKQGFALDITRRVGEAVGIPVIASGGAGTMEHFVDVFTKAKADAALAASIFHFHEIDIPELKIFLSQRGITMRTRQ